MHWMKYDNSCIGFSCEYQGVNEYVKFNPYNELLIIVKRYQVIVDNGRLLSGQNFNYFI